jgi:hypothetical protein
MSGSGSVNANVTLNTPTALSLDLQGLDDIGVRVSGGEAITLDTNSQVGGKVSLDTNSSLNTRSEVAITEPVNLNTNATIDVKPLVFDLRLSLGKIVPAYLRMPYRHHFGFTFFGVELAGFTVKGEQQVSVQDTPPPAP